MASDFVAVRLFEFLDDARDAVSMQALDAVFLKLIGAWGFDRWTATPISSAARSSIRPFEVVFGKSSREWRARYQERGYFRHDAVLSHLMRSNDAVWWTRFSKEARLSHEERMLFDEAREYGVAEGLTAPVRLPDGSVWVCALTGETPNPRHDVADAAKFAAERYILQALELRRPVEPELRGLSVTPGQARYGRRPPPSASGPPPPTTRSPTPNAASWSRRPRNSCTRRVAYRSPGKSDERAIFGQI
jgi:hypothetical protein